MNTIAHKALMLKVRQNPQNDIYKHTAQTFIKRAEISKEITQFSAYHSAFKNLPNLNV
jgi:hypothetical protein